MRLVCPNCEAKYEVPEDAIPETGRDVQCANCGHAWYQMRPRAAGVEPAPAATVAAVPVAAPVPAPAAEAVPEPVIKAVAPATAEPAPVLEALAEGAAAAVAGASEAVDVAVDQASAAAVEAVAVVAEEVAEVRDGVGAAVDAALDNVVADSAPVEGPAIVETDAVDPAPVAAAAAPAAYAVDDSVLAILREEAEREANARKAEAAKPLEVQADLGIDAAMAPAQKSVEAASASVAPAVQAGAVADDRLTVRRSQLPDVEEIKSSLRPGEQPADAVVASAAPVAVDGRSSFRKGFTLVMVFAILGAALYVTADTLAAAVPALAGVLQAYVAIIDSLRLHLDGLMQSATVAINGSGA